MPYRGPTGTLPDPFWGVYARSCTPMLTLPGELPDTLIYFTVGGAPHLAEPLGDAYTKLPADLQRRLGFDKLAGSLIRVERDDPPSVRHLTQAEALELDAAFAASRVADGIKLEIRDNKTGDDFEHVHVGGFFHGRPFQVRYSGAMPYRLLGAAAAPWERFLGVLDRLAGASR